MVQGGVCFLWVEGVEMRDEREKSARRVVFCGRLESLWPPHRVSRPPTPRSTPRKPLKKYERGTERGLGGPIRAWKPSVGGEGRVGGHLSARGRKTSFFPDLVALLVSLSLSLPAQTRHRRPPPARRTLGVGEAACRDGKDERDDGKGLHGGGSAG